MAVGHRKKAEFPGRAKSVETNSCILERRVGQTETSDRLFGTLTANFGTSRGSDFVRIDHG